MAIFEALLEKKSSGIRLRAKCASWEQQAIKRLGESEKSRAARIHAGHAE
jgi:hypothetical protein